jgi:hypothetical protein
MNSEVSVVEAINPCALRAEPSSRCLLEAIQGLFQTTKMLRILRILKPRRLPHKYLLLKNTMEGGILNIQLTKSPATMHRE